MKYQPKLQFEDKYCIKEKTISELRKLIEKVEDFKNIEKQIYDKGFDYIYGFFVTGLYAAAGPLTFCVIRLNRFSKIKDIRYSNKLTDNSRKKVYNIISKDIEYIETLDLSSSEVDK